MRVQPIGPTIPFKMRFNNTDIETKTGEKQPAKGAPTFKQYMDGTVYIPTFLGTQPTKPTPTQPPVDDDYPIVDNKPYPIVIKTGVGDKLNFIA